MWKTIIAFSAVLALGACTREEPAPPAPENTAGTAPVAWSDFVTDTLAAYYEFNPEQAVEAGKHEFDGRAADLSLAAADKYGAWLDERIAAAGGYEPWTASRRSSATTWSRPCAASASRFAN